MDTDTLGDILQRHPVKSVLRKQMLRGIEYLLHRFGALLGLRRSFRLGFYLGRQNHFPFRSPRGGHSSRVGPTPDHNRAAIRSEEHTSELQSLMRISYAVFCLKKQKNNQNNNNTNTLN